MACLQAPTPMKPAGTHLGRGVFDRDGDDDDAELFDLDLCRFMRRSALMVNALLISSPVGKKDDDIASGAFGSEAGANRRDLLSVSEG